MGQGYYDTMQVCVNGHVISASFRSSPQNGKKFCTQCGAATIHQCPSCRTSIDGTYHVPDVVFLGGPAPSAPAFCKECGAPFPWTEDMIGALDELADEFENLAPQEREVLKSSLHDLVQQNQHESVAQIRIKKLAGKIGSEGAGLLRNLLQNHIRGEILKSLFGG